MVLYCFSFFACAGVWVVGGLVCSDFWSFHKDSQKVCSVDWVLINSKAYSVARDARIGASFLASPRQTSFM
nr:hypothetical protein CFP56_45104 [Quercus suber]